MEMVACIVAVANGCDAPVTIMQVARIVGPGGDQRRGQAIVQRAIKAGLVKLVDSDRVPATAHGELVAL